LINIDCDIFFGEAGYEENAHFNVFRKKGFFLLLLLLLLLRKSFNVSEYKHYTFKWFVFFSGDIHPHPPFSKTESRLLKENLKKYGK
jgi:hypothetical protein